jgi:hypothetical protein
MRDHRRQLVLEIGIRQRDRFGPMLGVDRIVISFSH